MRKRVEFRSGTAKIPCQGLSSSNLKYPGGVDYEMMAVKWEVEVVGWKIVVGQLVVVLG